VELFGLRVGSWRYRLATWLPVPGVLGATYWSDIAVWIAVPTNIVCGLFLPASYLGFCWLQRSRSYLGDDVPGGTRGRLWLGAMLAISGFLIAFLGWYLMSAGPGLVETLFG
jgi:hypothetical protein